MLGEKRSRAAFQEESSESVQNGKCADTGKLETGNVHAGYKGEGQKRTGQAGSGNVPERGTGAGMPVPVSAGEAYLDSLLSGCLGGEEAGCPDSESKAMGDDRGTHMHSTHWGNYFSVERMSPVTGKKPQHTCRQPQGRETSMRHSCWSTWTLSGTLTCSLRQPA